VLVQVLNPGPPDPARSLPRRRRLLKQGYYRRAGDPETGVLCHDGLRVSRE